MQLNIFMKKLLTLLLLLSTSVWAWQPTKPINVITGYSTGSTNELTFRKASEIVTRNNPGVSFVIRSQPGQDGAIAMNAVVASDPDGYNVGVPSIFSLFVANDIFQNDLKKYQWDSLNSVAVLGESPVAIIAAVNSSVNTPAEFLQLLKKPTRFVNIATGGGTTNFLFEYLMYVNGSRNMIENIPYKSTPEIAVAVAGGQTEFGLLPVSGAWKLAEAGKLKIIAVTGDRPLTMLPNVPVMTTVKIQSGWMFSLPPNTPKEVIDWYQQEFGRAIKTDEYRQWADNMLITVDHNKLDPASVKKYGEFLRRTFLPVAEKTNMNK